MKLDIIYIIIEILLMILLFFIAKVSQEKPSNMWRLLYACPVFFAIIMVLVLGYSVYHIGIYGVAALQIVALYMVRVKNKRILSVVSIIVLIGSLVLILIAPGYRKKTIYKDFRKMYSVMRDHYVLTDEKGINWDSLYEKYEPLFKRADQNQDFVQNYKLWQQFTGEFYDGHVSYQMKNDMTEALAQSYGNDYGLSIVRLSSGEYVAVNVEGYDNSYSVMNNEEDIYGFYKFQDTYRSPDASEKRLTLKNAGIKNGTIISKWNGKPIEEYFDEITYYAFQYPVRENEEFYQPLYVAGIGKDMSYGQTYVPGEDVKSSSPKGVIKEPSVDITFINENGQEETITAPSLGIYSPRMFDTCSKIDEGVNITNLNWRKMDDSTYMIRISEMAYDKKTYLGTDYKEMQDKLMEEVKAIKEKGGKNIIFDLRANSGGSPFFVNAIAQIFAPEGQHLTYYSAVINEDRACFERDENGKYKMGQPISYEGQNLWEDGQIILLVNAMTVSAGDDMTYIMGDYPNVKVMGVTSTNSSCQAVTSTSGEYGELSFSAVPTLLPDGKVAIDTFKDHVGRTPFDERIPLSQELISGIFDRGEDYILNYAADSFEK
ncbi:MAG: hypothetical protein K6E10_04730 [Eubacterium sp.]|nr:hypothetical protein [Eubacterium sp.]